MILWDLADRARPRLLARLTGYTGTVWAVAFASDRRTLATGSGYPGVVLWDLVELNGLGNRPIPHACALTGCGLSPDEWARYVADLPYQNTCAP